MPQNNSLFTLLRRSLRTVLFLAPAFLLTLANAADDAKVKFDVAAGEAGKTLKQFAQQAKREIMFPAQPVGGVKTNAVQGELTVREALDQLLAGTELRAIEDAKTGALVVQRYDDPNGQRVARTDSDHPSDQSKVEEGKLVLDTFEVMGSKVLNMDLLRSRDDIQPYVTFDRETIESSGAMNMEDFLKSRLTMNTTSRTNTNSTGAGILGATSTVNLRGLSASQTLILLDGHRASGTGFNSQPSQADLNAIPLSAIQRIEILPTTSAGIYGGNANGGVINVVLRRDYVGSELKFTYDNTFSTDAAGLRIDLNAGFALGSKTQVLLAASYSDRNPLWARDRDFYLRGVARIQANNPSFILNGTTPPLGATANIRSSNGSNLVLKNGTPLNSPITFAPDGYAGGASDGGAALVVNAGRYNLAMAENSMLLFGVPGVGTKRALLKAPRIESLTATMRHQFNPTLQAFLNVMGSNETTRTNQANIAGQFTVAATAPTNPFTQAVIVRSPNPGFESYPMSWNYNRYIVGGLVLKLPGELFVSTDVTWNRHRLSFDYPNALPTAGLNIGNTGVLDVIRDARVFPTDFSPYFEPSQYTFLPFRSVLKDATLRFSKPIAQLNAGPVSLAGLLEYRNEEIADAGYYQNPLTLTFPGRSQNIRSLYLESHIPLISEKNRRPLIHALELQLAGRRDDYVVHSVTDTLLTAGAPVAHFTSKLSSSNPTVGLKYAPTPDITLRASYGTGFLPPFASQLMPSEAIAVTTVVVDPRRGNETISGAQSVNGGNPTLKPEESKSLSAGLIITPRFAPGLRLSVDYTKIDKIGNIAPIPGGLQGLLNNEALFPDRVVRGPVPAGDSFGVGRVTFMNVTQINLGATNIEAFDFALEYTRKTRLGNWTTFAAATWNRHFAIQIQPGQPFKESIGLTHLNPLQLKANAGVTWKRNKVMAGWSMEHFDGYWTADPTVATNLNVILSQGDGGRVASQTYHNVVLGYSFESWGATHAAKWLTNRLEVQVGVKNVLGRYPPEDVNPANISTSNYSPFGDPRLASYWVSLRKSF